jgi:hypothetical protein
MISSPLLERARPPAGDLLDGRQHLRLVELAVDVEPEGGLDVLLRHDRGHLNPCLVIRPTTGAWDQPPEPGVIADMHAYIHTHRRDAGLDDQPFDLVVGGSTPANAAAAHNILGPLADAGAT